MSADVLLRLKAMEKSFTFLLMEAATRLSELTESQMFILIETPEGRTFTGSPDLCDKYAKHGLFGHLDDVMLKMDEPQPNQTRRESEPETASPSPSRKRRPKSSSSSVKLKEPKLEIFDIADAYPEKDFLASLSLPTEEEEDDPSHWTVGRGRGREEEEDGLWGADKDDPSQWIAGRGSSKVWEYFDRHEANVDIAKCKLCNLILKRTGGTTSPLRIHLRKAHEIEAEGIPNRNGAVAKKKYQHLRRKTRAQMERMPRKFVGDSEFQAEIAEDETEMVQVVKEEPSSTVNGDGGGGGEIEDDFSMNDIESIIAIDTNDPSIDITDISKDGTELNALLHEKLTEILNCDPLPYFDPSSKEHKQLARCLYKLGNYLSEQPNPKLGHLNPVVHKFFNRSWAQFADEYLADFISRLPEDFGTIKTSNKVLKPRTYLRKLCNDNFRHCFRRTCIRETFGL